MNLDHIATLRQVRRTRYPDLATAAGLCELAGADGITLHLRGDRRHIQDRDLDVIRTTSLLPMTFEMAPTAEMLEIALRIKPRTVTLVPERPEELTTEGGLRVDAMREEITRMTERLQAGGIRVLMFIEPDEAQLRSSKDVGADGALVVTPYYNKPTQHGLYEHHRAIAEAVDIPQILYNVPGRTACDMLPETVARIAELDNVIGIKEATGEMDRVGQLLEMCPDDFLLLSGDDETSCEFMLLGGHGVISVTANVAPALMHELCVTATAGDRAKAEEIDKKLVGLHQKLFLEANPIPVKWAVARLGLIEAGMRLPMTWLSEQYQADVEAAMKQAGVI